MVQKDRPAILQRYQLIHTLIFITNYSIPSSGWLAKIINNGPFIDYVMQIGVFFWFVYFTLDNIYKVKTVF